MAIDNLTQEQLVARIEVLEETVKALNRENLQLLKDLTDKREPSKPPPVCPCMTAAPDGSDYTPPRDLVSARRDAKHFRNASVLHLSTIEDLHTTIARLTDQLHGTAGTREAVTKRLTDANTRLKAENQRLRLELEHASSAWKKYQGKAQSVPYLFQWGQYWQAQAQPFTPSVIRGRRPSPLMG